MARFNVTVEFSLGTTVEPDFYSHTFDAPNGVEEFSDDSYFGGSNEVECDGGSVTFIVECEDEDEAREKAEECVQDGNEVEDSNGLTWTIENVNVEVEEIEVELSLTDAIALVRDWLRLAESGQISDEVRKALDVILAHLASLAVQQTA